MGLDTKERLSSGPLPFVVCVVGCPFKGTGLGNHRTLLLSAFIEAVVAFLCLKLVEKGSSLRELQLIHSHPSLRNWCRHLGRQERVTNKVSKFSLGIPDFISLYSLT